MVILSIESTQNLHIDAFLVENHVASEFIFSAVPDLATRGETSSIVTIWLSFNFGAGDHFQRPCPQMNVMLV